MILFVNGLGLCVCFVGVNFISFEVVVLVCVLCDIQCFCGPCFTIFLSYFPDRSITYLNSDVRCVM